MKILLINISLRPDSQKIIFPIGLGYIATAIDTAGFDLEILDLDVLRLPDVEIEDFIKHADFDVVAMGCIVTGYRYVKKLCKMIKKYKEVPIIVGNSVATSIIDILMNNTMTDIGVFGEGDITIVELLSAIEQNLPLENVKGIFFKKDGKIHRTAERELIKNLDELPTINYELFDMDVYLNICKYNIPEPYPIPLDQIKALPINTSRGCPFNCTFCYHVFKNKKYRMRSIENIGKEIKMLKEKYGINYIQFFDELTLHSKKRADDFANYFLENKLNVSWIADCRAGLFDENDGELLLKLKEAGCVMLGFSLESADENILSEMDKHITVDEFISQTRALKKACIIAGTSLVLGYPQETPETMQKTFDCCYDCSIYPSTGFLLPQPGTPVYDYAIKIGKIQDEEEYLLNIGDRQDFTINLTTMSQEKIERIVKENLARISEKLGLGLDKDHLVKTGHYRQRKETDI